MTSSTATATEKNHYNDPTPYKVSQQRLQKDHHLQNERGRETRKTAITTTTSLLAPLVLVHQKSSTTQKEATLVTEKYYPSKASPFIWDRSSSTGKQDDDDDVFNDEELPNKGETKCPHFHQQRRPMALICIFLFIPAFIFVTISIGLVARRREPIITPNTDSMSLYGREQDNNDVITNTTNTTITASSIMRNNDTTTPNSSPMTPTFSPTTSTSDPTTSTFDPTTPIINPMTPSSSPTTPTSNPMTPTISPTSPTFSLTTPTISPTSPTATPSVIPTWSPSSKNSNSVGLPPSNITVGAYYYPWHGDNFHEGNYLRKHLNQQPYLGEYDDSKPEVIAQHLAWSRQANIRLWITSWWGPDRREDTTTKNVILTHRDLLNSDHQIALFYETTGRIKKEENYTTQRIVPDIDYICTTYFDHPNYYRIDGRPVLFIYLTRELEIAGIMEEVISSIRSAANYHGYDVFMIGNHVWQQPPSSANNVVFRPFSYLDAMTNYDVYESMMGKETMYAGQDAVSTYYNYQRQWKVQANANECGYIPAVSPGYNDRGVRLNADHLPLSRKLNNKDDAFGSLFASQLQHAKELVDETTNNLLLVNSFNEWHQDTQIEPAIIVDDDKRDGTTNSNLQQYTNGVEYQGYGELYLNLLRDATMDHQV